MRLVSATLAFTAIFIATAVSAQQPAPNQWAFAWPETDFTKASVEFCTIIFGGVPKDGIRAIDEPGFAPIGDLDSLAGTEPVIGLIINGVAKACPL